MPESNNGAKPLAGVGVLVTRPAHQAGNLARLIENAGGIAIRFPTIDIVPPVDPDRLLSIFDHLAEFDLAIFISPNAVEQAFSWLRSSRRPWPETLPVVCVGRASADAMAEQGVSAAMPSQRFDSEALLELPMLQDMTGKRIVIFRGVGGRELLGNTLTARGAAVTYAECYRRVRPSADAGELIDAWRHGEIQIVSLTSAAGLRNLYDMIGETGRGWLLDTPVVVLSQAQATICRDFGWRAATLVATEASDEAILETLKAWREERSSL